MSRTGVLLVAHGTRDAAGQATSRDLAAAVAARFDGRETRLAFVDGRGPSPAAVLAEWAGEARDITVVPLFLGSGYHVRVDIPDAVRSSRLRGRVRVTAALTPASAGVEPEVLDVLVDRWAEVSSGSGDAGLDLVLGAAGSRDPLSVAQAHATAAGLAERLGRPVRAAFCTAEPRVAAVAGPGVGIVSHLLAPGHFHRRLVASGAGLVTAPLGAHPRLVDLVERRVREAEA